MNMCQKVLDNMNSIQYNWVYKMKDKNITEQNMKAKNQFSLLRKKSGYTQSDVSHRIGVDQSAVAKWEAGIAYPKAEKLPTLAKLYGCTIEQLLDVKEG